MEPTTLNTPIIALHGISTLDGARNLRHVAASETPQTTRSLMLYAVQNKNRAELLTLLVLHQKNLELNREMFADFLIAGENEAAMLVSITSGVTLESICEQFARVVNDAKYPGELAKILVNSGDFEIVARLIRKDVEPSLIESKAESYKMIINSFNAWLYLNESTITLMLKQTKLYMNVKPTIDFMEFMYKHMPHVDSLLYCPKKLEIEPGTKITANLANDLLYNSVLRLDRDGTELMIGKFGTQLTERQRIIITAKSEEHKNLLTYIDATAFW